MKHMVCVFGLIVWFINFPLALGQSREETFKRAEREIRRGKFAEAETSYRSFIQRHDQDQEARLGLSLTLVKQGRFSEAYVEAARVASMNEQNSRARALMGVVRLRQGDFSRAILELQAAIQLNNKDTIALGGAAEAAFFENQPRLAYNLLKRAIQIDPREPDFHCSLARACSRLELYNEAADAYETFLHVAPKTDVGRRERIRGLIAYFRYLGSMKLFLLSGQAITTAPIEVRHNRPFLNLMINGCGPFLFVIDTGASLSVVSEQAAGRLGIKAVARGGYGNAIGGDGLFPLVYSLLDSISIGETKIGRLPIHIRTIHHALDVPPNERADGYLGLSALSDFAITIDYQNKTLTLDRTTPREPEPSGQLFSEPDSHDVPEVRIPIRSTSSGLASTEAHLAGVSYPLNLIIDTAATGTVISKAAVKTYNLDPFKLKGVRSRVSGAAGIDPDVEVLGLTRLTVNGLQQRHARALILDMTAINETAGFEQHGILGGDFLRHFKVQLDLRRYTLTLKPQGPVIQRVTEPES